MNLGLSFVNLRWAQGGGNPNPFNFLKASKSHARVIIVIGLGDQLWVSSEFGKGEEQLHNTSKHL